MIALGVIFIIAGLAGAVLVYLANAMSETGETTFSDWKPALWSLGLAAVGLWMVISWW